MFDLLAKYVDSQIMCYVFGKCWQNRGVYCLDAIAAEKCFTSSIEDDLLLIAVHCSDCALGADGRSCV